MSPMDDVRQVLRHQKSMVSIPSQGVPRAAPGLPKRAVRRRRDRKTGAHERKGGRVRDGDGGRGSEGQGEVREPVGADAAEGLGCKSRLNCVPTLFRILVPPPCSPPSGTFTTYYTSVWPEGGV